MSVPPDLPAGYPQPQFQGPPPSQPETKKPKKWPWIAGGVAVLLIAAGIFGGGDKDESKATAAAPITTAAAPITTAHATTTTLAPVAPIVSATTAAPASSSSKVAAQATTTRQAPVPVVTTTVAPAPAKPQISSGQRNAVRSAQQYIDMTAFSRSGLIEQLEYEDFSTEDATYAVDSLNVDWNKQAALSAEQYLEMTSFSLSGLIEQLEYEGFTSAQAAYGANAAY